MLKRACDRVGSASHGIGCRERGERPILAALPAGDPRIGAALLGAALAGLITLLTASCATAPPTLTEASPPPVPGEPASPVRAEPAPEARADMSLAQTEANERTRPGARFRDCEDCPEMVVVPAGSYLMGSPPSEEERDDNEGPQHPVAIGEPFAAGVFEVTFEEWDACVNAGGCGEYRPDDGGMGRGRRPVMNVSWKDAQRFVEWLREVAGESYRLLSEAEWEYAARAGTTTAYHYGEAIALNQANGSIDNGWHGHTLPVGSFDANAFGLHDVHGNVWEYVQDCWNISYRGAPGDGSAWETGDCSIRVWRGGSWRNSHEELRSANRAAIQTFERLDYIGFRVARTLTP